MRKILRYRLALFILPLFFNPARSQSNRFAYAVTSVNKNGSEWVALRKLDTRTGEFSNMLLNMTDMSKEDPVLIKAASGNNSPLPAVNSGVAAIAYDRKTNRLYYVSMNDDQLRYVDLATMTVNGVISQSFSKTGHYGDCSGWLRVYHHQRRESPVPLYYEWHAHPHRSRRTGG